LGSGLFLTFQLRPVLSCIHMCILLYGTPPVSNIVRPLLKRRALAVDYPREGVSGTRLWFLRNVDPQSKTTGKRDSGTLFLWVSAFGYIPLLAAQITPALLCRFFPAQPEGLTCTPPTYIHNKPILPFPLKRGPGKWLEAA